MPGFGDDGRGHRRLLNPHRRFRGLFELTRRVPDGPIAATALFSRWKRPVAALNDF